MRFTELRETVKPRCCSSFVIARSLSPSLCKRLNKGKGTDLANNGWRVRTKFILLREISTVGCKLAHCCCMGKRMLCFNMGVALKKDGRARSKEERKLQSRVATRLAPTVYSKRNAGTRLTFFWGVFEPGGGLSSCPLPLPQLLLLHIDQNFRIIH